MSFRSEAFSSSRGLGRSLARASDHSISGPQDSIDAGRELVPFPFPGGERLLSGGRQFVILPATIVGLLPVRRQQFLPLQPVQSRIQAAFLQFEISLRPPAD